MFAREARGMDEESNRRARGRVRVADALRDGQQGLLTRERLPDDTREETYEDKSITSPEEREKHFWQKDHVRLFGLDYPKRLEKAGFKVEPINLWNELGPELRERYRLMEGEIIYWAKKEA